jgi:hypothetical protein
VVSILGWASTASPLSFRGATYSGVCTLLLLTGKGRAHHGEIVAQAAALADAGLLSPIVDPAPYYLEGGGGPPGRGNRKVTGEGRRAGWRRGGTVDGNHRAIPLKVLKSLFRTVAADCPRATASSGQPSRQRTSR